MVIFICLRLFLLFNLISQYCFGNKPKPNQDCFVYEVLQTYTFDRMQKESFTIGYLKLSKDANSYKSQIFIYLFSEERNPNSNRTLQVYLKPDKTVTLIENGTCLATSKKPLQPITSYPVWETFLVKIEATDFQVLRLGSVIPIVRANVSNTMHVKWIQIMVSNGQDFAEYVTLNCAAGCQIFNDFERPLEVNLSTSLTINMMSPSRNGSSPENTTSGRFSFGLVSSWFDDVSEIVSPRNKSQIELKLIDTNAKDNGTMKRLLLTSEKGVLLNATSYTDSANFTLKVNRSENVWWSFNCELPFIKVWSDWTEKRSIPYPPNSPKVKLSIGEVTAWVIASLSLCGLLIVALTLYSKVSHTESQMDHDGEIEFGVSASHIGTMEMLPYPREKSMFYTEIRKPDEGVALEGNRLSAIKPDLLRPMDVDCLKEEEISCSLRSYDTAMTCLSKEEKV